MRPVDLGEALREGYLAPLGMSVNALAAALGVPATRIHRIVKERRSVTADTAARLAMRFGGDAASWLVLKARTSSQAGRPRASARAEGDGWPPDSMSPATGLGGRRLLLYFRPTASHRPRRGTSAHFVERVLPA